MSRAIETLSRIPLANLSMIAICCITYLYQILDDPPLHYFTMCPRNVIYLHDYYRILTSAIFHGGLMHLGMNMMSTAAIGSLLEKRFGTLQHAITILWGILLTSTVYLLVAFGAAKIVRWDDLMYQHSVGFSAVLFQLSVLEANLSPEATRSVFGFVTVPAWAYPWALLVALQFFMPQISFMGHLSGILVGTLQSYGLLDGIMPSHEFLRELEETRYVRFVKTKPGFVPMPSDSVLNALTERRHPMPITVFCHTMFGTVFRYCRWGMETLRVMVLGNTLSHQSDWGEDDEDEWVMQPVLRPPPTEVNTRVV